MKIENSNGFTIVEVIAASFLVSMGLLGVFGLIERIAMGSNASLFRLAASHLGQEGIEIVRNMRDSNFLKINQGGEGTWIDGLTSCIAGCEIDYNDASLSSPYIGKFLKNDESLHVYSYDAGQDTKFQRRITIIPIPAVNPYMLSVVVDVFWTDRGKNFSFQSAAQLFNWYNP